MTDAGSNHGHSITVIAIYATRWRWPDRDPQEARLRGPRLRRLRRRDRPSDRRPLPVLPSDESPPFELGRLVDHWPLLKDKLPRTLAHCQMTVDALRFTEDFDGELTGAESRLFLLPSGVVVAALSLDAADPLFHTDPHLTVSLVERCAYGQMTIDGLRLADWIDDLARGCGAVPSRDGVTGLPPERHQIVFVRQAPGAHGPRSAGHVDDPVSAEVVKRVLYRIDPPYREGFAPSREPRGLKQRRGTLGVLTPYVTLIHGHEDYVKNNLFLTAVQAVGTEARFRQIWHEAYGLVRDFRERMQAQEVGVQKRADLEGLVDALGNLELDLSFSVEAAADLGLLIPSLRIESYHRALYEVMELHTRAQTVSQMFRRLDGSIQSEITAIEIRERRAEEARRVSGGFATSLISTIAVPIGFLVAFFGINAREVSPAYSIFDLGHYRGVYLAAVILALIPAAAFLALYGKAALDIKRHRRMQAAGRQKRTSDVVA